MNARESRFNTLFADSADAVRRYVARRHIGHDVDDLVAEVFTIAWQKLEEIPTDFELPWLYRTAWFTVANAHRKNIELSTDLDISGIDDDIAHDVIASDRLLKTWSQLPARDREVLRLAAWEGLSGAELAAMLGMSEGGATAALSRARVKLRQAWDSY